MTNFEKIIAHFNELKTCPPADVTRHSLALLESYIFIDKEEQKEFLEFFNKWKEQNNSPHPYLLCYIKLITAFSFYYSEQYETALPLLTETQNLFLDQNDLNGAAICTVLQGSIYRTFGNVDLALKALWAAHEQLKTAEAFQFFFMGCSFTMGGTYLDKKHYTEAIPLFKDTLEIAERTSKYYWIIYALQGLGKVYLEQKKYDEARECLEKAMVAAGKFNRPIAICNSLSESGNYYFAIGDYAQAAQFHKRALLLREQNHFIGGAITSCIRLGEIYMKQQKTDDAMMVLEKGLVLAEQLKVKLKMYQVHLLLSGIYESKNDAAKSLFHYKLYHQLHEQVEIEDNARRIKNAQLVFEAEQTKKENIIIKKQKQEIEKKNIELQETIDELTRVKIGRKAKAITLIIAIVLFILDDFILHYALTMVPADNYFISLIVKMVIIFSLSPINSAIERYLLKKVIRKKKKEVLV